MKYALNLTGDGRVLSATYEQYAQPDAVLVDSLPNGDLYDYRYVDGEFVYDPLPKPVRPNPVVEPTTDEVLNAMLGVM